MTTDVPRSGTSEGEGGGESGAGADRRAELLAGATAWAVDHGLAELSLRPLAKALGTSDRMLVYYFGTKDDLVAAIAADAADALAAAMPAVDPQRPPRSAQVWLDDCWALLGDPGLRPALALLFELDSRGVRDAGVPRAAARLVAERWVEVVDDALAALGVSPARRAAGFTAVVAGALVGIVLDELVTGGDRPRVGRDELARLIDAEAFWPRNRGP